MVSSSALIKEMRGILLGIDSDEISDPRGWWETSEGAQFGAMKLRELEDVVRRSLGETIGAE